MEKRLNFQGDTNVKLDSRSRVTVRATKPFIITSGSVNEEDYAIHGPNSESDRYFQSEFARDTLLNVETLGHFTVVIVDLPERDEYPDPESMCEVVEDHQLSMYDRLKAEMFNALSVYAESKGLDTVDDEDNLDFFDDDGLINTPYEYEAMKDEFLKTLSTDGTGEPVSEITTNPPSETTTSPDAVETTTSTTQPADSSAV